MKRIYLLCFLLLPCAAMAAKNKISMVTYFPIPYVAYSQVNTEQIDIGLANTCDMKLGCAGSAVPLWVQNNVNLTSGRLNLNGGLGILGNTLMLGSGNSGTGHILFQNLRIKTGEMQSVRANTVKVENLKLFDKTFPSCLEADPQSNGQMKWTTYKLADALNQELYLACGGEGEAAAPDCSAPMPDEKKRVCPGKCGWQYTEYECVNGKWQESWGPCDEYTYPLGDFELLYNNKALCCPLIKNPRDEFEQLDWDELPSGAPCYDTKLDRMELVDDFAHGSRCPVDEYGTQGCPNEQCDAKDIFEKNCLNWMNENDYCWVDGDKTYDLYNHGTDRWWIGGGTHSYKCRAKPTEWH